MNAALAVDSLPVAKFAYHVAVVCDSGLSTLFFGGGNIAAERLQRLLCEMGDQGWRLSTMVTERRRFLLFWNREAVICTFEKPW